MDGLVVVGHTISPYIHAYRHTYLPTCLTHIPTSPTYLQALAMLAMGDMNGATELLQTFSSTAAETALKTWNNLFEMLIAKYRDGYKVGR